MPDTVKENPDAQDEWEAIMSNIDASYRELQRLGIPAQDCRGVLPTNVMTNIIMKANLRTMADLLASRKGLRAQGEYASVAREWERLILDIHPWTQPFLSPDRTATPRLDALLARELGNSGPLDKPELNEALKELDKLKAVGG